MKLAHSFMYAIYFNDTWQHNSDAPGLMLGILSGVHRIVETFYSFLTFSIYSVLPIMLIQSSIFDIFALVTCQQSVAKHFNIYGNVCDSGCFFHISIA